MDDFNLWDEVMREAHELPDTEPYFEEYEPPQILLPHVSPYVGCRWDNPFRVVNDSYTTY